MAATRHKGAERLEALESHNPSHGRIKKTRLHVPQSRGSDGMQQGQPWRHREEILPPVIANRASQDEGCCFPPQTAPIERRPGRDPNHQCQDAKASGLGQDEMFIARERRVEPDNQHGKRAGGVAGHTFDRSSQNEDAAQTRDRGYRDSRQRLFSKRPEADLERQREKRRAKHIPIVWETGASQDVRHVDVNVSIV